MTTPRKELPPELFKLLMTDIKPRPLAQEVRAEDPLRHVPETMKVWLGGLSFM